MAYLSLSHIYLHCIYILVVIYPRCRPLLERCKPLLWLLTLQQDQQSGQHPSTIQGMVPSGNFWFTSDPKCLSKGELSLTLRLWWQRAMWRTTRADSSSSRTGTMQRRWPGSLTSVAICWPARHLGWTACSREQRWRGIRIECIFNSISIFSIPPQYF